MSTIKKHYLQRISRSDISHDILSFFYDTNVNIVSYVLATKNGLIFSNGKKFNRKYFIENLNK